jgi:nitroimidazol reductase NimA-like FMN-containing flavoprotein (pyridoxamine 5'-phosphate oxidase superfamily)
MTKHGEVTAYAEGVVRILDDTLLAQRTIAITYVSVVIHGRYPMIPRETRRQLAARLLEAERKRRKELNAIP